MTTIIRKRGAVTRSFPRKQEFIQKVRECQELARQMFPEFNLSDADLPIVFVEKGRNAGMAKWQLVLDRHGLRTRVYNIEFSIEAIGIEWDDMVNDTIPHEMAHIVDFVLHGKGNGHGPVWKRIARRLGCTGKRTHSYNVTKARQTKKHVYVASCGTEIILGAQRHSKIQNRGTIYTIPSTRGKIAREHYTGRVVVS